MNSDLDLLNRFNEDTGNQATIYTRKYHYDCDGEFSVHFYQMSSGLEHSTGECRLKYLGSFNGGDSFSQRGSGFVLASNEVIVPGYPMSKDSISVNQFRIEYKSSHIVKDLYTSLVQYPRFWETDFEKIKVEYPKQAEDIAEILNQRISYLANIQSSKGYKSSWVYYQFIAKLDALTRVINGQFLKGTNYFYSPEAYFNKYSSRLVSLSAKEKAELHRRRISNWNRWD